jgi:hypothetical protein
MPVYPLEEMLRLYVAGRVPLSGVWDWLAVFQWELTGDHESFAKEVEDALVYYHDDFLSEDDVRIWLSTLLEARTSKTVQYSWFTPPPLPRTVARFAASTGTSTVASECLVVMYA